MKTLFQSLSASNQRILVVSISASLVLLSLSCFILTLNSASAGPKSTAAGGVPKVGMGISDDVIYYVGEDDKPHKMSISDWNYKVDFGSGF